MKPQALTARKAGLIACSVCHLLCPAPPPGTTGGAAKCPRCGARLHSRKPDSIARSWALVIAACIFYIPANVLPMTTVTSLGMVQSDRIMSGVIYFVQSGSWPIALIIFIASVFVPLLKLFILSYLLISVQRKDTEGIHNPSESVGGEFGGANRHIECEDCHSPHASARSAVPGSNPAPAVQQEVYQSTGNDPFWTATGAPTDYAWMTVADREYQVCLKCHSSYSPLPSYSPDGYGWEANSSAAGYIADGLSKLTTNNPLQVNDNRDLATEFNSYQASFHPVTAKGRHQYACRLLRRPLDEGLDCLLHRLPR